ncbi:DUF1080 domain-containing protein [Duganella sp. Root1480D1]|uniref:3-keto-disaccharide hydrolase n=1 Tax=Duganella sp. Root1480D1 TaxID=1736471 RepID=UPI00070F9413|nr:DUF1080 domain-containing protein [Duganella sp. Root1480D1]KQZ39696.1 hypothetical protein ASD58_04705 [Duganella sp. Root1480D1]
MIKQILFTAAWFAATGSAAAGDMFSDLRGWELRTEPAADLASAIGVHAGGVVAVSGSPSGFFATTASYRNYRLHVEWRWPAKVGNAGVLLNISDGPMDRVWPLSVQVQTKSGNAGDLLPMAGAKFAEPLTGDKPAVKARMAASSERPAGEWNSADIVSRDGVIEVMVNGVPQNRVTGATPREGRIGFQLEGTPYELRHVELTPLE